MNSQIKNDALQFHQICTSLLNYQFNDKEEFTRTVIDNIFGEESIDLLRLKVNKDATIMDAYKQFLSLVGIDSIAFKTLYSNDSLFEEFICILCDHAAQSKASPQEIPESFYASLLQIYLEHVLPITEQNLNFMKNSNWFSAPLSCNPSTCVSSPRKLLRPEVLAASQRLELTGIRSASLRSVYPRLLQFVGNLITNLASLKTWPSIAQLIVLKMVLKYYHDFLLADTDDSDFCSLKLMLIQKPLFVDLLRNFLERILTNWQFDDSYINLIELWICLVLHPPLVHYKKEKFDIFLRFSTDYFIELFEIIISRIVEVEAKLICETNVLKYLEAAVFDNNMFNTIFQYYNTPMSGYMDLIRSRLLNIISKESEEHNQNDVGLFYKIIFTLTSIFQTSPIDKNFLVEHARKLEELSQKTY